MRSHTRLVSEPLQACDVRIRSISSDENRLRIYIDDFADKGASLSTRLRDALQDQNAVVLMEEKRYIDYTVRIVIQGSGTQESNYPGWLEHQAELRGVKSDVRRLATGDVEAIFSGERVEVGNMIVKCGLGLDPQSGRTVSLWRLDEHRFKRADGRS